jgi:mono/diheme cytochrome c family protein
MRRGSRIEAVGAHSAQRAPGGSLRAGAFTLLLLGVSLASLACGTARRGEPLRGPLALERASEQHGQAVFMRFCNRCHPGGEAGLGPGLNDKPLPRFLKRFQVRHGLGVMPSFSKDAISDQDLDALMDYLGALRSH